MPVSEAQTLVHPGSARRLLKGSIIGAGQVGMACAYSMVIQNTLDELVISDIARNKAEGEVMDLVHGIPFVEPTRVRAGELADCAGSDVVILTAGAKQRPEETRLDLVQRNVEIFKSLIPAVMEHCPDAILLVVSNPVDIMTYVSWKLSGLPTGQVIGSGTVLDTARFRYLLAERLGVDPRSLHAYIIGEHGDSEVAVWSKVNVAGTPIGDLSPEWDPAHLGDIFEQVRNAAYEIIRRKGATSYAIGLGVTQIVQALLRDQHRVLTVSSLTQGEYGLSDVCLSLPNIIGRRGVERTLAMSLTETERKQLHHSAHILRQIIEDIQW
ncbi:L-lactate dehydrogenase [Synechococcus sp. Nb3U1]|uniref:L-lactate dehydrogenase n=1 Tax=Synechococcus sp. Nb3U1 TaxID=1914529 RepID=UPI001F00C54B|nr:L-lactate dehydrogenase [Synechococcus sp. Nb3U1]MCF2970562.1 L-lactate dehydrogenase [Synechococcus sp. Nb3U1]